MERLPKKTNSQTPKPSIKQMVKQSDEIITDDRPVSTTKSIGPIPKPQKGVKQMAQEYEYNIIPPPIELRDGWKPTAIEEKSKAL